MSNPEFVLLGIVVIAAVYVLLPVVGDAFWRFRGTRQLACPEARRSAEVGVDPRRAAFTAAFGQPRLRIKSCSLWPERQGCRQSCLGHAEMAEVPLPQPRAS